MFTGLIEATGTIERGPATSGSATGVELRVGTGLAAELTAGDSIAVNGVCLTATATAEDGFDAIVSPETLRVTTLGALRTGQLINLERPLKADARLGGHFVLGHVDGVGRIRSLEPAGDCYWLDVETPAALAPLLILKGSITVDGISLTIAELLDDRVRIQIVPFTFAHTALRAARAGDAVNIEADVIGKYVARLMQTGALAKDAAVAAGIS
jgi:riboflavin synthase